MTTNNETAPALAQAPGKGDQMKWDDPNRLRQSIYAPAWAGLAIVLFFIAIVFVWGSTAPLSSGAIAAGVVAPEGSRRTIQHYEGGIVQALTIAEGQVVKKGDSLLILGDVGHEANHDALLARHATLLARRARLKAEKFDAHNVSFPTTLAHNRIGRDTMRSQLRIFDARRQEFKMREQMLLQTLKLIDVQIDGYRSLVGGHKTQLGILKEELRTKEHMLRKGYARRPEVLRIRKTIADVISRHGELVSRIAAAQEKQSEQRIEFATLKTKRTATIEEETDQVLNDLREIEEKIRISKDILKRSVVRAPVTGRVTNLRVKTIGGVVRKGQELMDIVPSNERLIVEARVSPLDIDNVHEGLKAQVYLTAYSGSNTPKITGTVLMVSADRIEGRGAGQKPYYLAKVTVKREELKAFGESVHLAPGMPADVVIITGKSTMIDYLVQPFRDAMRRSFRS